MFGKEYIHYYALMKTRGGGRGEIRKQKITFIFFVFILFLNVCIPGIPNLLYCMCNSYDNHAHI